MKKEVTKEKIVIFRDRSRDITLRADIGKGTIWATQDQMAMLFDTQRPAITKHIRNIFNTGELEKNSVCSILEHTAPDGKKYKVAFYNLDIIIAVGYRVNSKQATQFRIWATQILRKYILKGYAVNKKRLKTVRRAKLREIRKTVELLTSVKERITYARKN